MHPGAIRVHGACVDLPVAEARHARRAHLGPWTLTRDLLPDGLLGAVRPGSCERLQAERGDREQRREGHRRSDQLGRGQAAGLQDQEFAVCRESPERDEDPQQYGEGDHRRQHWDGLVAGDLRHDPTGYASAGQRQELDQILCEDDCGQAEQRDRGGKGRLAHQVGVELRSRCSAGHGSLRRAVEPWGRLRLGRSGPRAASSWLTLPSRDGGS